VPVTVIAGASLIPAPGSPLGAGWRTPANTSCFHRVWAERSPAVSCPRSEQRRTRGLPCGVLTSALDGHGLPVPMPQADELPSGAAPGVYPPSPDEADVPARQVARG